MEYNIYLKGGRMITHELTDDEHNIVIGNAESPILRTDDRSLAINAENVIGVQAIEFKRFKNAK